MNMLKLTVNLFFVIVLAVTFVSYENLAVDIGQAWSLCK